MMAFCKALSKLAINRGEIESANFAQKQTRCT
jgi:hypothetical protein